RRRACSPPGADDLAPRQAGSLAGGAEARLAQDLADRRRRDAEPERAELASDPLVAPARVVAREAEDQLANLGADRRPTLISCRVGPAPRDELALPTQERFRRDEKGV